MFIKSLLITGSVIFANGPNVQNVNQYEVQKVFDNAWFRNKETVLTGYITFDNMSFTGDVTCTVSYITHKCPIQVSLSVLFQGIC